MTDSLPVTIWLKRLQAGDPAQAQPLWEAYFARLVSMARDKLRGLRVPSDEEDVALSALDSFFRGADRGRFPRLDSRDDLWQVLVMLTAQKATDARRREQSLKRGGGQSRAASELALDDGSGSGPGGLDSLAAPEPTPQLAAEMAEECRRLLDLLRNDDLRRIALDRMEGYSNDEIAARLGCSVSTVERKLQLIRKTWEREGEP